jgi:putative membrane protein
MSAKYFRRDDHADVVKGAVAGVIGGLLASFVMEQFQSLWAKVSEKTREKKPQGRKETPSTVKVAQSISKTVLGKNLRKSQQRAAGEAVHYAMGATSGAIYGAATETLPLTTVGDGLVFGTAVWLLADEVAVPVLGFSKSPVKYPVSTHLYGLASHLVYGWTAEMVRRAVRKVL